MVEDFIGLVLDQRYEIQAPLGHGGMALVFEAHQRRLGRQVAVKIIKPQFAGVDDIRDTFIQEAHISASLEHLHILTVYDFGSQLIDGRESPYLVMQLAGGGTLQERLERQPLTFDEAERVLKQVCSALDYSHNRRVIHLDLKPGNILFDQYDNALVADFGFAKLFHTTFGAHVHDVAGTPCYMPLEQFQGRPAGPLSDVYALGITLYEALTGELPERELTAEGLFVHLDHSLPYSIENVIERATRPDPNERYHTTGELAQAFTTAVAELASPPAHSWPDTEEPEPDSRGANIEMPESKPTYVFPKEHQNLPANKSLLERIRIPRPVISWVAAMIVIGGLVLLGPRWLKNLIAEVLTEMSPTPTLAPTITPTATLAPSPTLTPSPTIVPTTTPSPIPDVVVLVGPLPIYTGPDENSVRLEDAQQGYRLPLLGRLVDNKWWQVDRLGKKGWIHAQPGWASIAPTLLPVVQPPEYVTTTPTPTRRPTPSPMREPVLRLQNPNFENVQEYEIPGWSLWAIDNSDEPYDPFTSFDTPHFKQVTDEPARMIDGPTLQIQATAFVKFKIEISQIVDAPPDVTIRLRVATRAYSGDDGRIVLAAGIDPYGSAGCSQARWSEPLSIDQSHGIRQLNSPNVRVGDAGQVTVCIRVETLYAARDNAAYLDNAELIVHSE